MIKKDNSDNSERALENFLVVLGCYHKVPDGFDQLLGIACNVISNSALLLINQSKIKKINKHLVNPGQLGEKQECYYPLCYLSPLTCLGFSDFNGTYFKLFPGHYISSYTSPNLKMDPSPRTKPARCLHLGR